LIVYAVTVTILLVVAVWLWAKNDAWLASECDRLEAEHLRYRHDTRIVLREADRLARAVDAGTCDDNTTACYRIVRYGRGSRL
jgi:hypothetical protein